MNKQLKEIISNYKKYIIPTIAVFSVIICILEGYFYYRVLDGNLYVQILMNINNIFKAFLFSPSISIDDARKVLEQQGGTMFKTIVCYLYMAVVILAPICTAVALLKSIEKTARGWVNSFKISFYEKVFIFGYNNNSKEFIKNIVDGNKKVIIVTEKPFLDSERLELLRKGIMLICGDFSNGKENDMKYGFRKMRIEKADSIVLFENQATTNFSILLNIIEYYDSIQRKSKLFELIPKNDETIYIKCSISCEDSGIQEVITDYYDRYIDQVSHVTNRAIHIDLKLFSIPEIQVRELFSHRPIYQYNLMDQRTYIKKHYDWEETTNECANPWDTHLVIVGFGKLGQNVLLQALNLGNLQSKSIITIDVFDNNADEKKGIFAKRFSHENVDINQEFISFPKKKQNSDGKVIINFHKVDIRTIDFEDELRKLQDVTYVAICFEDSSLSTIGMVTIEKYFKNVPVAVQMDVDNKVIDYIKKNIKSYKHVFPFGTKKEVLDQDTIVENHMDKKAILYNDKYNEYHEHDKKIICEHINHISRNKLDAWNKTILQKKNSSRKLIEHEPFKIILLLVDSWLSQGLEYENIMKKVSELLSCLEKNKDYEDKDVKQIRGYLDNAYKKIKVVKVNEILSADKVLEELATLEHRRWCNFMFTNGYIYEDGKKDDLAKKNPCLLSWNLLCEHQSEMLIYDVLSILICAEKVEDDRIKF